MILLYTHIAMEDSPQIHFLTYYLSNNLMDLSIELVRETNAFRYRVLTIRVITAFGPTLSGQKASVSAARVLLVPQMHCYVLAITELCGLFFHHIHKSWPFFTIWAPSSLCSLIFSTSGCPRYPLKIFPYPFSRVGLRTWSKHLV